MIFYPTPLQGCQLLDLSAFFILASTCLVGITSCIWENHYKNDVLVKCTNPTPNHLHLVSDLVTMFLFLISVLYTPIHAVPLPQVYQHSQLWVKMDLKILTRNIFRNNLLCHSSGLKEVVAWSLLAILSSYPRATDRQELNKNKNSKLAFYCDFIIPIFTLPEN